MKRFCIQCNQSVERGFIWCLKCRQKYDKEQHKPKSEPQSAAKKKVSIEAPQKNRSQEKE